MKFSALVQALFLSSVMGFDKCNYQHADVKGKAPGAVRIMFVGDRMVSGEGDAPIPTDDSFFGGEDAVDGSHWGYKGFPYWFGELLKEKKPKQKFEIMNFGGVDYGVKGSFFDSCDYQKSLRADAEVVVMMFGASELNAIQTHEDKRTWRNNYARLGKEYLSLPSHPQVFLVTPPGLKLDEPIPDPSIQNRRYYSNVQMPMQLKQVADALNLPTENRIDLWTLFGEDSLTEHADWQNDDKHTPNQEGQNKIAEAMYNSVIKFNNFNNHEKLYKIGRKVVQDPNPWGI